MIECVLVSKSFSFYNYWFIHKLEIYVYSLTVQYISIIDEWMNANPMYSGFDYFQKLICELLILILKSWLFR